MTNVKSTSVLRHAARNALLATTVALLAACVSQGPTTRPTGNAQNLETRARAAAENRDYSSAATLYSQLATTVTGALRADYLLEAARFAIEDGDTLLARRRLTDARGGATRDQQQAITVLLARLEVIERRPQAALDMLATLQQPLPAVVLRDAAAARGQAYFQLGNPTEAVRAFVEREVWLEDSAVLLANQHMIWDGFRAFAAPAPPAPTGDRIVDGWLALAPLARSGTNDLRRELLAWRATYTDHPAAGGLLAELLSAQRPAGFPAQIALLLPMTSPQRGAALALRDGFIAAHLGNAGAGATAIRVYDTAMLGSQEAYLRAQLEGADFIVGPLLRPEVDQIIGQAGFVPTLALNFAQNDTPFSRGFYQFALWPEDEAQVIADVAAASGATTAIALVPSNDIGYRLLNSFRAEFEARGGQLLNFSGYEPGLQDVSQSVMALLNITRSNQRHRRLAANLGEQIQFEPRRRQDIDMIFVAGDSRAGRVVVPQLRVHFAGDIPTYSTSDVFDAGNNARDNDLNGVIFTDAPSLLAPDQAAADLQRDLQAYWPQRAAQLRLYGMGFDAYRLVETLYNGARAWPVQGMSGSLSLDAQGRIHRSLPLAQFRNGRPAAVETPAPRTVEGNGLVGRR